MFGASPSASVRAGGMTSPSQPATGAAEAVEEPTKDILLQVPLTEVHKVRPN